MLKRKIGQDFGENWTVELTFKNDAVKVENFKNASNARVDSAIEGFQNNDLIKSFKFLDVNGNVQAEG